MPADRAAGRRRSAPSRRPAGPRPAPLPPVVPVRGAPRRPARRGRRRDAPAGRGRRRGRRRSRWPSGGRGRRHAIRVDDRIDRDRLRWRLAPSRSPRPLLIGGALTSAALSLAGAASSPGVAPARARRWPERPAPSAPCAPDAGSWPDAASSCRRSGRAATPTRPTSGRSARPARRCSSTSSSTRAYRVCPNCGHHFRLSAAARLELLLDHGHVRRARRRPPVGRSARVRRPEALPGPRWPPPSSRPGMRDAAVWGIGDDRAARRSSICVMDFGFMGGSMGAVVGEKVTRAAEHALAERIAADRRLARRAGRGCRRARSPSCSWPRRCAALERLRDGRRARSSAS